MKYYVSKFKGRIIGVSALIIIMSLISLGLNFILMGTFDAIIKKDLHLFFIYSLANIIGWTVFILLDAFEVRVKSNCIRKMNNAVRADISATILSKSHNEFHKMDTGDYISWLTNDVQQIELNAWEPLFAIINCVSSVLFNLIALFILHWSLFLVTIVTALILTFFPNIFNNKMKTLGENCTEKMGVSTSKFKDLLSGFDVLISFGHKKLFWDNMKIASDISEKAKFEKTYKQNNVNDEISFVNCMLQLIVTTLMGIFSINGIIIQSALFGGGNIIGTIYGGFQQLANLRLSIATSKAYFEKITEHSDNKKDENVSGIGQLEDKIKLENVSFAYNENKPVLNNLSLKFSAGKKYAIIGASGCGKSTVLKLLLGWNTGYSGKILFDDKNIEDYTSEQIMEEISYISQDVYLFNKTIRENITMGDSFSDEEINEALEHSSLLADIDKFENGLDTVVGENGSNLSGGQKQRIAIARALIHKRSVLLVDEGTSALDQKNSDLVENSLLENPELTLILVSHHLTDERKKRFDAVYSVA